MLLDAICYNELGDPDDLVGADGPVGDWRDMPQLKLLNLMYDVTPTKFITNGTGKKAKKKEMEKKRDLFKHPGRQ